MTAYSWQVVKIINHLDHGRRGVRVRYTPLDKSNGEQDHVIFVPVSWHKMNNQNQAEALMIEEVKKKAPELKWTRDRTGDQGESVTSLMNVESYSGTEGV